MGARPRNRVQKLSLGSVPDGAPGRDGASGSACAQTRDATNSTKDNVENTPWLELLHLFPAVKNLYLCEEFAPRVVRALQELVGVSATEVLPNLQNIFLEELQESGPVREGIQKFIGARQVTSHPIAVSLWENSQQDREKILRY
jgi:hypothetical protein